MHHVYDLPQIPKKAVESVPWRGDYVAYDHALYLLGQDKYDQFIIVNPAFPAGVINSIMTTPATKSCIVWYHEGTWVAKLFTRGWRRSYGYMNLNLISDSLDVIFISYNEPNAEENWQRVLEKAPWAKRIDGVTGILEAHKAAANIATTDMFYVVDGDAYLADDWKFNFQPKIFDRDCVYVWHSQNPVNGLVYGYGGVKLFPTNMLRNTIQWNTDLTTGVSKKLKVMPTVSNVTRFNTTEFNTWRSAFRECAKLASGIISGNIEDESSKRMQVWMSVSTGDYGQYSILGAIAGHEYGIKNKSDTDQLKLINNREWLEAQFELWNTNT